ncbi:myoglobin-like [Stegodyphus dumicola]|uniref:myoglobin-like n=1 Tax=Stegodyphus dumicola TaxID=202533 RepID=UPI0015B1AAB6|nr:myoglobin-like [Stegodyphus dumicola]
MSLFETHPDVQDVFMPFKGLTKEELRHSKELRAHGLRVMGFVQKVVARLDEPAKSEQLLKELGRNHVMYGAKIDYVDLIGPQFVFAVKPSMKEHWSDEIEEAWMQLFRFMAYIMKKAMIETTNPPPDANQDSVKEPNKKAIES